MYLAEKQMTLSRYLISMYLRRFASISSYWPAAPNYLPKHNARQRHLIDAQ